MKKYDEYLLNEFRKALEEIASIGFVSGDELGNVKIDYNAENHRKCNEIACEALCLLQEQSESADE